MKKGHSFNVYPQNRASFLCVCVFVCMCLLSHVRLFATLWIIVHQAHPSMGSSRQEHWSGLPFPSPEGLPDPGIEPVSLPSPALESRQFTTEPLGKLPK